jgi:hypothetical protein
MFLQVNDSKAHQKAFFFTNPAFSPACYILLVIQFGYEGRVGKDIFLYRNAYLMHSADIMDGSLPDQHFRNLTDEKGYCKMQT